MSQRSIKLKPRAQQDGALQSKPVSRQGGSAPTNVTAGWQMVPDGMLSHALDALPSAVVIHDGRSLLYANQAAARLFGAGLAAELRARPLASLARGEGSSNDVIPAPAGCLAGSGMIHALRLDGTVVPLEAVVTPFDYSGGNLFQVLLNPAAGMSSGENKLDINAALRRLEEEVSDRKKAEENLRASEKRLRKQAKALGDLTRGNIQPPRDILAAIQEITEASARALEVERVGVWLFTEDRSALRCADLFERSVEHHSSGEELPVKSAPLYFKALAVERAIVASDVLADPRTAELRESYLIPLDISSMLDSPVRIGNELVGVVCHEHVGPGRRWTLDETSFAASIADLVSLAVTDAQRSQAEAARRSSEERFRRLAESTNVLPWEADAVTGRFTYVGPQAERLFGYPQAKWFEDNFWENKLHPDDRAAAVRLCMEKGRQCDDYEFDYRMIAADGREVWVHDVVHVVRGPGGPERLQGFLIDITGHKRLEQEILEISERERQSIGQDLHDDLCQQLTGIKFRSSLLAKKLSAGMQPEAADADQITALIEDAVVNARNLARGLHPVELESNGLASALQALASNIEKMFQVRCRFECQQAVTISENRTALHLYRIAQEAINNALKHGQAGQIKIGLKRANGNVALSVADDGIGFKPRASKKAGMGLHIMNYRARMIGGKVEVRSKPGKGAEVLCLIPVQD